MVPTEVPTASEMKQATRKSPPTSRLGGDESEGELDGRVDGAHRLGGAGEGSGEDEDETHHHDVDVAHAVGEEFDLAAQRRLVAEEERGGGGDEEGDGHGDLVEVAGDDGEPEIKDEEDGEGDQRAGARFAVDGKIFDIHEHTFPVETK